MKQRNVKHLLRYEGQIYTVPKLQEKLKPINGLNLPTVYDRIKRWADDTGAIPWDRCFSMPEGSITLVTGPDADAYEMSVKPPSKKYISEEALCSLCIHGSGWAPDKGIGCSWSKDLTVPKGAKTVPHPNRPDLFKIVACPEYRYMREKETKNMGKKEKDVEHDQPETGTDMDVKGFDVTCFDKSEFTRITDEDFCDAPLAEKPEPEPAKEPESAPKPEPGEVRAYVMDEAKKIILHDRQQAYGDPEDNFSIIANLWGAYLNTTIRPEDVAMMMIHVKQARMKTGDSLDNFIDIAGYAACGGEIYMKNKEW